MFGHSVSSFFPRISKVSFLGFLFLSLGSGETYPIIHFFAPWSLYLLITMIYIANLFIHWFFVYLLLIHQLDYSLVSFIACLFIYSFIYLFVYRFTRASVWSLSTTVTGEAGHRLGPFPGRYDGSNNLVVPRGQCLLLDTGAVSFVIAVKQC